LPDSPQAAARAESSCFDGKEIRDVVAEPHAAALELRRRARCERVVA
jgi:hypothetical protein